MATIIRVPGADFSAVPHAFIPPVADGLEAWHYLGGSLDASTKNLAPGKAAATVVGTPTVASTHLVLSGSAHLQTAVPDAGDCTLIA
ncbi:hypothetical protein KPL78_29510, partial [Roseomonas sp. HJA6]